MAGLESLCLQLSPRANRVASLSSAAAGLAVPLRPNWLKTAGRSPLIEAARTLGGRARRVEIDGKPLDNGQHILLGAYTESLRLMRQVGIRPDDVLLRLPLQMR